MSHFVILVMVLGFAIQAHSAATPSVDEIVKRTEHTAYYRARDGRARVSMRITDSQGRERKRRFTILRRDQYSEEDELNGRVGEQKYYVHIGYPSDLRNTVLLVWKHNSSDDDRWLYLPALDLAKRIAASDKRTSFLGSDFYYEDISGRSVDQDHHELVEVTDSYYVVKNIPKQPNTVEFSSYTMWIHKETFLPVKVEFYNSQGDKHRIYEVLQVEIIQGYPTVTQSRMQDLSLNQQTVLEFSKISYDIDIVEDVFTERYLRNPPRNYLR